MKTISALFDKFQQAEINQLIAPTSIFTFSYTTVVFSKLNLSIVLVSRFGYKTKLDR